MRRVWVFFILLVACIPNVEPTPTPDSLPTLAPSPTVLPIIPDEDADSYVGRSDPTAAALAAEGEPSQEAALAPAPTDATIPLSVMSGDGVVLRGDYYGAAARPAPAIVLLYGEPISGLAEIASALQTAGYNVLLLGVRGFPDAVDWSMAEEDARAAFETLQTLPSVSQMGIIGFGRGAAAALTACRTDSLCLSAVLVDPLADEFVPGGENAGNVPSVLILANSEDLSSAQTLSAALAARLETYPDAAFEALAPVVMGWFTQTLPLTVEN